MQYRGAAHGDFHDVWIDPTNPNIVFAGDDGGLWRSQDGGNALGAHDEPAGFAVLSRER